MLSLETYRASFAIGFCSQRAILDFEVTREKKYRLLLHNGSLKEQVPKRSIQVWYSKPRYIGFNWRFYSGFLYGLLRPRRFWGSTAPTPLSVL